MAITNEKELAESLSNEQDTIEIHGDLAAKVVRIKATGTVAWVVALGAIGIAVLMLLTTGGAAAPVSGIVGVGAVSVLGLPAAVSAVMIAVAAGGVGVLSSLRDYKIESSAEGRIVLKRS